MSDLLSQGSAGFMALLPVLLAVFAGCILFLWLLAYLGCRILSGGGKEDRL